LRAVDLDAAIEIIHRHRHIAHHLRGGKRNRNLPFRRPIQNRLTTGNRVADGVFAGPFPGELLHGRKVAGMGHRGGDAPDLGLQFTAGRRGDGGFPSVPDPGLFEIIRHLNTKTQASKMAVKGLPEQASRKAGTASIFQTNASPMDGAVGTGDDSIRQRPATHSVAPPPASAGASARN
jgi:hypothetical protein